VSERNGLVSAGLKGVGVLSAVAGLLTINRTAVRKVQKSPEPVAPRELEMPPDVVEHLVPVSGGGRIRVLERGPARGRPVVLLHGITLSAAVWPYQMKDLGDAGFRVFAVDFRGHGSSPRSRRGRRLTLDRLAEDIDEVVEHFDLKDTILVGHSMGGMVALRMLAGDREPVVPIVNGRVSALMLLASSANVIDGRGLPAVGGAVALTRPILARASSLAARLPGPTLPASDLAFTLARVTFGSGPSARQVMFTGGMAAEAPVRVSAELLLDIVRFDGVADLEHISIPTTVVAGDHDLMTPLAQSEILAERIPSAELVVLRGCGHMVMLERPDDLNDAIFALAERSSSLTGRGAALATARRLLSRREGRAG
jgi:non-heme chloroperoxidase